MPSHQPAIQVAGASFAWPDGDPVLDDATIVLDTGRIGLVGRNGSGKSTLLRLVAGELRPTRGTVSTAGAVAQLPQDLPLRSSATVADLLGVRERLDALAAIEAGRLEQRWFDQLDDDWNVAARSTETLSRLGLPGFDLARRIDTLSGGEAVLIGVAGLLLSEAPICLLDEPTNNLDRRARAIVHEVVATWPGTLVVVSHDTALLDRVDTVVELREAQLSQYGGNWTAWQAQLATEQQAVARDIRAAEQKLALEKRQRITAEVALARRQREGRKAYVEKRRPKMIMQARKREAQVSAAKYRAEHSANLQQAQQSLAEAEARLRDDATIRIDLPDPELAVGRRIAEFVVAGRTVTLQGPERVALVGPNGAGKTTLVETLLGIQTRSTGVGPTRLWTERCGYLPQRIVLDPTLNLVDTVRATAPDTAPAEIRVLLARFGFRGDRVSHPVAELSGGERFRVALARLLATRPTPELLVLDEPTNNLDLESMEVLVSALVGYRGALLVVSHDDAVLTRLGITRTVTLGG